MKNRYCRKCNVVLTTENCHKGCFRYHNWICKSCRKIQDSKYNKKQREQQKIHQRERMRMIKRWAVGYLGGKCEECDYSKNISAFDFHHEGNKKEPQMRKELFKWFKTKIIPNHIHLLCSNCHREKHNPELSTTFK